jgi:hypothetical protein
MQKKTALANQIWIAAILIVVQAISKLQPESSLKKPSGFPVFIKNR